MNRNSRSLLSIVIIATLTLGAAGCAKLAARDELNKGVGAFKSAQFDQAIEFFKQAKEHDPTLINARLYLAAAYAAQYIPGAPSEENIRKGKQAVEEYKDVLNVDPNNLSALDGIGSILFAMAATPYEPKLFEESKSYHLRHIQIKPDDTEPYYWVAVINWTLAFRANMEMRNEYNQRSRKPIKESDPLPAKLREQFAEKYTAPVDEGIQALKKAIQLRPDYDDAMAYLNLLYRQRADIVAEPQERESFLDMADELVDKVKEIKQKKMEGGPAGPPK